MDLTAAAAATAAAIIAIQQKHLHHNRHSEKKKTKTIHEYVCVVLASTFLIIIIVIVFCFYWRCCCVEFYTVCFFFFSYEFWFKFRFFTIAQPLIPNHFTLVSLACSCCIACQEMKSFSSRSFIILFVLFRSENLRNDEIMCNIAHADNEKENRRKKHAFSRFLINKFKRKCYRVCVCVCGHACTRREWFKWLHCAQECSTVWSLTAREYTRKYIVFNMQTSYRWFHLSNIRQANIV